MLLLLLYTRLFIKFYIKDGVMSKEFPVPKPAIVTVPMPAQLKYDIQKIAFKKGVPVTEFIRDLCKNAISKENVNA
jgi:hypothetical protein